MKRITVPEQMDRPDADMDRLQESLRDLRRLNRYAGGTATVLYHLRALLPEPAAGSARPLRVLDVGAGGGDVLRSVRRWCAGRGWRLAGLGLDRGRKTLAIARADGAGSDPAPGSLRWVQGDAAALPFGPRSFDVVLCNTTLHHLTQDAAVAALAEMSRVARVGVVVTDLRRGWGGYVAARLLAATVWRRHPYARHDGPASVRAAYTMSEAGRLAERAGLSGVRIQPHPGFRWALRWRRTG